MKGLYSSWHCLRGFGRVDGIFHWGGYNGGGAGTSGGGGGGMGRVIGMMTLGCRDGPGGNARRGG